jgi:Cupin domain
MLSSCILKSKRAFRQPPVRTAEGNSIMIGLILKRFEKPDEVRIFDKGRFEIVQIGTMTIGRASYEPRWKWSQHVAPIAGKPLCDVEHVGMVVSGRAMAAFADGTQTELTPGDLFYIPPTPHDSWVIGDEPYVSLHFVGADHYTK